MNNDIAISVKNVSKDFVLPHEKVGSVKGLFTKAFNRNKSYEKQHVLKDISFEIKKGEFFGIVGRNGSGKSTLLKIIAGIYQPTRGSVKINGRLVPFIELGVGFSPDLSGRENVYLNGAMLGFSKKEVDEKYNQIVDFAELEKFMDQKLKNFSSGMQVRLAFSVATVLAESDILLIDEVLAVGDADFQGKCYEYFLKLKSENKTVIFVSHDMSAVRLYCDRAILIDGGSVSAAGSAQEISDNYLRLFESTTPDSHRTKRKAKGNLNNSIVYIKEVNINEPISEGNNFSFSAVICAEENLDNIIVGFTVKNNAKEKLIGTNTVIVGCEAIHLSRGEELILKWSMPNIFSSGTYYIDVAMQDYAYKYLDNWQDAAIFKVNNIKNTPYNISPIYTLEVERRSR